MIDISQINLLVDTYLRENGIFIVNVEIRKGNHIRVFIDSLDGITVEDCAKISRIIESGLDRETEDFDLEVSSPGLDASLKVYPQYVKNLGKDVNVLKNDGTSISGKLLRADVQGISLEVNKDIKGKTAIAEQQNVRNEYVPFSDIKTTRVIINF
jgi:ribosome maturation factor RimP